MQSTKSNFTIGRALWLVIIMCTTATFTEAQILDYEQVPKSLTFGPRVGFTTSTITGNGFGSKKFQVAYVVGGFARYQISKKWALEGQVNYAHRGVNFSTNPDLELNDGPIEDFDLRYIDLPVIANYNFSYRLFGKEFNTDVFGGAQVSFLASAKSGGLNIKNQLNSTDVGLVIGSGFNLGRVLLYGTTKLGLLNINDNLQTTDISLNTRTPRFKSISSEWTIAYRLSK